MYKFKLLDKNKIPWEKIESCYNQTVYKSKAWMDFLCETQKIIPFVMEIYEQENLLGYFVGEKFKRGINIIASPFEGWTTSFQGLSLVIKVTSEKRIDIYKSLIAYLFESNSCTYFQVSDWYLEVKDVEESDLEYEINKGYVLDLTQTEEEIHRKFNKTCRYQINKGQRNGLKVREAQNTDGFVDNYYNQLIDVFGKQRLNPTYKINRVRSLVKYLHEYENILLLETINEEGKCIATGIFVGDNEIAFYWGGASYREYQYLFPNDMLMYEAIKYWKKKGIAEFEFGGGRGYKEKYGPVPYEKPKIFASKHKVYYVVKKALKLMYYGIREQKAKLIKLRLQWKES